MTKVKDFIREYESDTFSFSGFAVTKRELGLLAHALVENLLSRVDGVLLDALLYEIRENDDEEKLSRQAAGEMVKSKTKIKSKAKGK